jgi:integral membrane sensor domain MASE1
MPRFGMKDLFVSTTLIAAGLGYMVAADGINLPDSITVPLWFVSGAAIGAGICHPFRLAWVGAIIGALAILALAIYVNSVLPV